jgi:quinol monooxygenase YgiN
MFSIPPRSPDLNPIENLFHLISKKLEHDALDRQIQSENFEQFSKRVRDTMMDYPITTIDNIIKSMGKRITMIIKKRGERLKY